MRKKKDTRPVAPPTLAEFEDSREIAARLLRSYRLEPLVDFLVLLNTAAAHSDLPAIAVLRKKTKSKVLRRLITAVYDACEAGDYIAAANVACGIGYRAGDMQLSAGLSYFDERQAITKGHTYERRITIPPMSKAASRLVWVFYTPGGKRRLSVEFFGNGKTSGNPARVRQWDGERLISTFLAEDMSLESEVSHA